MGRRGKELPTAYSIIEKSYDLLGALFPDLLLFDSLYFNQNVFKKVREKNAHLLIKSSDPNFRAVLIEAKFSFDHKNEMDSDVTFCRGFDSNRMCSWNIESTSGSYAGFPVSISHLTEYYPKNQVSRQHAESWITTTDLTLSQVEIREAAHLRT